MTYKNNEKTNLIFILVWILIIFSILFNIAIISLLWQMDHRIKGKNDARIKSNAHFNHHLGIISKYAEEISLKSNLILDVTIKDQKPFKFPSYGSKEIQLMVSHKHGPTFGKYLFELKDTIDSIKYNWGKIVKWRDQFNLINEDIILKSSLSKTQNIINDIQNAVLVLEGKIKLQSAKKTHEINQQDSLSSPDHTEIIKNNERMNKSRVILSNIKTDLAELSTNISSLSGIINPISLTVLKDNELKQNIDHLTYEIKSLEKLQTKDNPLTIGSVKNLATSIFGNGYSIDNNKQSIILGEGGLYSLYLIHIKLIEERKELIEYYNDKLKDLNISLKKVDWLIHNNETILEEEQEKYINQNIRTITVAILFFCILLFLISLYIINFIKTQISLTEQALKEAVEAKEKAELITRVVPSALFTVDNEQNVTSWNEKSEKITGFSAKEVIGKKCSIFADTPCNDRCELMDDQIPKPIQGKICTIRTKDGRILTITKNADNLRNAQGKIIGSIEIFEDITEKIQSEDKIKKANERLKASERALKNIMADMKETNKELQNAQEQLVQSEKLSSLGQLSAGIAHEINNPLGFITNNIDILEEYVESYSNILRAFEGIKKSIKDKNWDKALEQTEAINQLEEDVDLDFITGDIDNLIRQSKGGAERIRKIVQDLRTFARKDEGQMELYNVEEIIEGVITIVWNEIKYTSELKKDFGNIPLVRCNSQKLGQVFINLIVNASHAIKEKGVITIKTYSKDNYAHIEVSDNGVGIPDSVKDKIFDPFFTTKDVGKGTGLGLSIAYDIIKQHNGIFEVESKVGEGTTFTIKLPIQE